VREAGRLAAGDAVEVLQRDPRAPTVDDFVRLVHEDYWDVEGLDWLLAAPALPPGWRPLLEEKRRRAAQADGWLGARELRVVGRSLLAPDVAVLSLACPFGRALPRVRPGDALTLSLAGQRRGPRRAFPLWGDPGESAAYRVVVRAPARRDPLAGDGVVSGPLFDGVEAVRAGPPRPTLGLPPADAGRVVLLVDAAGAPALLPLLPLLAREAPRLHLAFLGQPVPWLEDAARAAAPGVSVSAGGDAAAALAGLGAPPGRALVSAEGNAADAAVEVLRGLGLPAGAVAWARWPMSP